MTTKTYDKEIDGLRAISVLVVLLYHLKVGFVPGGFLGVDVFFVISGYLITQIILSGLQSGGFTFREFFLRRTTRILPALIATIALTLFAATLIQQPAALHGTARQSLAALFSVSNIFFWLQADYWARSAEAYPLLHTWSLGVEEQFYLVYPLFLFLVYRLGGTRAIVIALAIIVVAGTFTTEKLQGVDRMAAFYLTPFRFFEFAAGGLGGLMCTRMTWLRGSPWIAGSLTLLGLFCIFVSVVLFHPMFYDLPGALTLLPVMGALAVMLAGASPVARVVLCNSLISWLGKTSYSLYLVHWPIIVFYRYYYGASLSEVEKVGLFLVILLTAEALARLVERRFRLVGQNEKTAGGVGARSVLLGILAATIIVAAPAALLMWSKGWPTRMPEEARHLAEIDWKQDMYRREAFYLEHCTPRGELFCGERQDDRLNILLLGDSRVLDIYIALKTAYPQAAIRSSYAMGCPAVFSPAFSTKRHFAKCPEFNVARLQEAIDAPSLDVIFLANDIRQANSGAILETAAKLRDSGKPVYLLGQFLRFEGRTAIEVELDARRFGNGDKYIRRFMPASPFSLDGAYADRVRDIGAVYVSQKDLFFDGEYHLVDRETGQLLTYDAKHLNFFGARKFGEYLKKHYPLH